jgi:hypothetical protein
MAVCMQRSYVPCGCKAHLSESDPRAEIWRAVFGKLEFPLLHPIKHEGQAVGEPLCGFLQGDWNALSEEEQVKLAGEMKKRFGVSEAAFIAQNKAIGYIPIKDVNITVVCCQLHSRMMM